MPKPFGREVVALLTGIGLAIPAVGVADAPAIDTQAPMPGSENQLQEVVVTAPRLGLIGTATTASQGVVVNEELALTPAYRPGQLLETVPGLSVTVHSGEGKANQYLLRGYNLDHGTDLGIWVDGMPVNEPTHAHGQGYADLNFMIAELATNVAYTKGPYYANQGDFSTVGSVHINYLDEIADQVNVGVGTLDWQRVFSAASQSIGGDGHLLEALELQHYDGPWVHGDDQRKINMVLRYSQGDDALGYSVTGMFYHGLWNATTDQPLRAIDAGLISHYGSLDPSDGGQAQRASLSAQLHAALAGGTLLASAYVISNHLTLWNNFTHYLVDPINGDQEQQHEDRATVGADASYAYRIVIADLQNELLVGLHTRYDFNDVLRLPTQDRVVLTSEELAAVDYPPTFSENDQVRLNSFAAYVQDTTHWTYWLRSVIGFRDDLMSGSDVGTYTGTASRSLPEPKVSLILTPVATTEFYLSYGVGFHSDDLRGVNQARIEDIPGAPLIARQRGEEFGVRQQIGKQLAATLAIYNLDAQSETTYDPDVGQDSAGPGSHRYGFELNATYQALHWLEFYGSFSANHARYTSLFDDGTGHVGYYLPNAPFYAGSFNVYVNHRGPWDGGLEYRLLGPYPLSSDNVVYSSGYGEWNADAHYTRDDGWRFGVGVYNLLNSHADSMEYWYIDRLPGEPAAGVPDIHLHPLEPLSVRFTVGKLF